MWTVFDCGSGCYSAVNRKRRFFNADGTWDERRDYVTPEEYAIGWPGEPKLTPAETKALFKKYGRPDGKPASPVKRTTITDRERLTAALRSGIIEVWNGNEYSECETRREIDAAIRAARKAKGGR